METSLRIYLLAVNFNAFQNILSINLMYYRIHEKLGQQNVVVMSTFQKYCSVTFLHTLYYY
jgi:hypothetical protein